MRNGMRLATQASTTMACVTNAYKAEKPQVGIFIAIKIFTHCSNLRIVGKLRMTKRGYCLLIF